LVEAWPKPVVGEDDDFDEVNDCRASSAEDAAPRASNMAKLQPMPQRAAQQFTPLDQQTPCHRENLSKIWVFCHEDGPVPRQLMPLRQNFPPTPR
jgi:hypothetical protein